LLDRDIVTQSNFNSRSSSRPIGLCLSGGGSRAIAFHLGCLRALNQRNVLPKVDVISTVSGGSVIGAMYAYTDDSFANFEQRVRGALKRGFVKSIAFNLLLSPIALEILATKLIAGTAAIGTGVIRHGVALVERMLPHKSRANPKKASRIQPPLRRWASRTTAFEATLASRLFGDLAIDSARRNDVNVVVNACELRTGTAFRFGNRQSGNWRFGSLENNEVTVAFAVAASAAYPALLPAIDRNFSFNAIRGGEVMRKRVILTDGGVYDNLGVTCMEPGRTPDFSTNVYSPDYIICCDAGAGQFDDTAQPYGWATRMARSFETTFRQVQHGAQARLHQWQQHGSLKGFVYAYLGQQDDRLPSTPNDFVTRERVANYPTDFSPMPIADIEAISRRGEQLMNILSDHYCPELR
jgi:NTE family protein